jgi:hypothetical protein
MSKKNTKAIDISRSEAENRTSASTLLNKAKETLSFILKAYPEEHFTIENADNQHLIEHLSTIHFLFGRTIELALKSFLRSHNVTVIALREIGHCLITAYEQGMNFRLAEAYNSQSLDQNIIKNLNSLYCIKGFEYPTVGAISFVPAPLLHDFVCRLLTGVGQHVMSSYQKNPEHPITSRL